MTERKKWENIFLEDCAEYDKKIAEEYTTLQERIVELEKELEKERKINEEIKVRFVKCSSCTEEMKNGCLMFSENLCEGERCEELVDLVALVNQNELQNKYEEEISNLKQNLEDTKIINKNLKDLIEEQKRFINDNGLLEDTEKLHQAYDNCIKENLEIYEKLVNKQEEIDYLSEQIQKLKIELDTPGSVVLDKLDEAKEIIKNLIRPLTEEEKHLTIDVRYFFKKRAKEFLEEE